MKKIIPLRKIILIIGIALTVITSVLFLIYGNGEGKISSLIATFIVVPLVYLFVRLSFYVIGKNGTKTVLDIYSWFFIIGGLLAVLVGAINFFTPFPSGSMPLITTGFTLIVFILQRLAKLDGSSDE